MIIENHSDLNISSVEVLAKIKDMLGDCRPFSMRYTIKILITKNYDAIGLLAIGEGNNLASMSETGVDIWEIGNIGSK